MKLKKILACAMAGAMVLGSLSVVSADTVTVTNAAWWDAWTPTYEIADGATIELEAELTVSGTEVYQTLNAVFVNVATDGVTVPADTSSNYYEYVVLRSDAYGWGDYYATTTYTGTDYLYNADITDYSEIMTGATYDITITRNGTTINYDYVITEADGTQLNCGYEIVIADLADSDSVYVFFTGDSGVTFSISEVEEDDATEATPTISSLDTVINSDGTYTITATVVNGDETITDLESSALCLYWWVDDGSPSAEMTGYDSNAAYSLSVTVDPSEAGTYVIYSQLKSDWHVYGSDTEYAKETVTIDISEETLIGSGWWTDCQTSTAISLADGESVTFTVEVTSDSLSDGEYAAFCVEATDGTNYFTATSDGDCWGAGTDTDGTSTGAVVGGRYVVTITRNGNNFTADIIDDSTGLSILANPMVLEGTSEFGDTTCYIMTQVGNLTVLTTSSITVSDETSGDDGDDDSSTGDADTSTGDADTSTGDDTTSDDDSTTSTDDDSWSISVSDVAAGKTAAATVLGVDEDELTTVSSYEVVSTENVGEGDWTVVLSSDEFIAGTTYAVHIGNSTYAEVLTVECTEDGTLTIEYALGTEIAGIYYVASDDSDTSDDDDSTTSDDDSTTSTSEKDTSDASAAAPVVIAMLGCAVIALVSKRKMA